MLWEVETTGLINLVVVHPLLLPLLRAEGTQGALDLADRIKRLQPQSLLLCPPLGLLQLGGGMLAVVYWLNGCSAESRQCVHGNQGKQAQTTSSQKNDHTTQRAQRF